MELSNHNISVRTNSTSHDSLQLSDNTLTFIIGFGILLLFVILGILASAFLCFTLKKDPYLWEVDRERQLQEHQAQPEADANCREKDKFTVTEDALNQESTQI